MPVKHWKGVQYPTYPTYPTTDPLQGVALPSYPSWPSYPQIPSYTYWAKGGPLKSKPENLYFNYNDPYEINSVADIILGSINPDMKHAKKDAGVLGNVLFDTMDLMYKGTIKPILKGQWGTAGLNLLVNIGETMDILANPVKGLFMEGKQGMLNAFGLGGKGRVNYDADTGNIVTDLMVEIIVDPFNWVTLFGKGLAAQSVKAGLAGTLKEVAGEAGEEVSEQVYKKIAKNAVKAYLAGDVDTLYDAVKNIAQNYSKRNIIKFKNIPLPKDVVKAFYNAEQIVVDWMSATNLKSLQKIIKPFEKAESLLFKSVLNSTGIVPAWWAVSKGANWVAEMSAQRTRAPLKQYLGFDGTVSFSDFDAAKKVYTENIDLYNMAMKLSDEDKLTPEIFSVIMRESVIKDNETIENLFKTLWGKPDELTQELQKYLQGKHKVNSLDEYLAIVKDINLKTGNAYLDVVQYYEEQIEILYDLQHTQDWKIKMGVIQEVKDITEEVILKPVEKYFVAEDNGFSLMTSLENTLKALQTPNITPTTPQEVYQELQKVYNNWYSEAVTLVKDNMYKINDLLQSTNKDPYGMFNSFVEQLDEALKAYDKHIRDQFKTVKALAANKKSKMPLWKQLKDFRIDYNSSDIFRKIENMIEAYNLLISSGPVALSQNTFKDFISWANKSTKVQSEMLETLIKTQMHDYGRRLVLKESPDKNFEKIRKKLAEFYMNIPKELEENISAIKEFKLFDYQRFKQAVSAFLEVDISNTDAYVNAFNDVKRELNTLQAYAEYLQKIEQGKSLLSQSIIDDTGIQKIGRHPATETKAIIPEIKYEESELITKPTQFIRPSSETALNTKVIIEEVTKLKNAFEELNPITYTRDKIKIQAAGVMISFKLEQMQNSLAFVSDSVVDSFISDINYNTGIGKGIQELAKVSNETAYESVNTAVDICREIVKAGENYRNYVDLLNSISRFPLRQETRMAFISTLQRYATDNPALFLQNFDKYFKEIVEGIETQRYGITMKYSLSLETFKENLKEYIKQNLPDFKQHTAESDIQLLELVMQKELANKFDNPFNVYAVADIETSSGDPNSGSILEISVKEYNKKDSTIILKRKLDKTSTVDLPQKRILNKTFPIGSENPITKAIINTEADQVMAFYDWYSVGISEKEMLEQFIGHIHKLSADGRTPVLVFHNGDKFDVNYIKARLEHWGLDTKFFDDIQKRDTFKLLKEKEGYYVMNDVEQRGLYQMLYTFTRKMADTGGPKLVDPSNGELASQFMKLADLLKQSIQNKTGEFDAIFNIDLHTVIDEMHFIGSKIYDQLQHISQTNKNLQWLLLDTNWLESLDGQKFFINYLQTVLGLSPADVVKLYGEHLNPSKLIYALSDGANYLGYRNTIDFGKILEWFRFKEGEMLDPRLAKAYTGMGRSLDKIYNNTKRPERLEPYADKIKEALEHLIGQDMQTVLNEVFNEKELLTDKITKLDSDLYSGIINWPEYSKQKALLESAWATLDKKLKETTMSLCKGLRTDKADVRSDWAILQYLYNGYKRNGLLERYDKLLDPDIKQLLEHPEFVNNKYITTDDISALVAPVKTRVDELFAKPEDYKIAIADAQRSAKDMADLGRAFDVRNLFRPKTQTLSAALMEVHDMLTLYDAKMNSRTFIEKVKLKHSYKAYADNLAEQQLYNILTMSPDELQQLMVWRAPWFEFDISYHQSQTHMLDAFTKFLSNEDELKLRNINIFKTDNRYYVYLDKAALIDSYVENGKTIMTLNGHVIPAPILKDLNINVAGELLNDPEMAEALFKTRQTIHRLAGSLDATDSTAIGSVGDMVTKKFYDELYKQLPEEVRKNMPDIDWLLKDKFFKRERFNFTNLGTLDARRVKQPYGYGSIISLYQNSSQSAAVYAKSKVQYAQLWFNSGMSINTGWLSTASDKDLFKLFKDHPEYMLVSLVEDAKQGYKVLPIPIRNTKDIADAKRLGAVLMDYQTFSTAYETINSGTSEGVLNLWNKITYLYKVGYLMDPGVWLRNLIDSMMKNFNETGSLTDTMKAQYDAAKLYNLYDECVDDIIKIDSVYNRFRHTNAIKYFTDKAYDGVRKLDKETYDFIHAFIMDGPSAGLTGNWAKYYSFGADAADDLQDMWDTVVHWTRKTMIPNQHVEQITRLAEYLMFSNKGFTNAQAFQKIAKTHFDYAIKTDFEKAMEVIFPFYTFTMRNLHYWVNAVNEHPWMTGLYRDVMTPIWDFDDTDHYELSRNRSLQYQILSGNIPLHENGITLKTSPSFMDAYNIITQPLESAKSRMAAPLQYAIDTGAQRNILKLSKWAEQSLNIYEKKQLAQEAGFLDQNASLIPIIGTLYQRYFQMGPEYYKRTGNLLNILLPSTFGATLRYQPYGSRVYPKQQKSYKQQKYISSAHTKSNKFKKPYKSFAKRVYATRTYAKRSYVPNIKYYKNYYNKRPRKYESFYKNHYSKTGKSKMLMRMRPTNTTNLKFKLKDLFRYYR